MKIPYLLNAMQANRLISEILQEFAARIEAGPLEHQRAVIENVAFEDIFFLYAIMQNQNRQIFMPGELFNETITIVYMPCAGCTIAIESEPCVDFSWKIHHVAGNIIMN